MKKKIESDEKNTNKRNYKKGCTCCACTCDCCCQCDCDACCEENCCCCGYINCCGKECSCECCRDSLRWIILTFCVVTFLLSWILSCIGSCL